MSTCSMCFDTRHGRCTDKLHCGCTVCGTPRADPYAPSRKRAARTSNGPRVYTPAGPTESGRFKWSGKQSADPDNIPELVLELLQNLVADLKGQPL